MKNKEWSGEGVPPIGTVCEYKSEDDEWRKCEVVAYYLANVVAVDVLDSTAVCVHFGLSLLRPIKTYKQMKAEEQLQVVDEMLSSVDRYSTLKDIMCALYNAGYRKQAKK